MKKQAVLCVAAVALALAMSTTGRGDNGTWNVNADGNWSVGTNWLGNTIADGADYTGDFSQVNITNNRTVTLDSARTIGHLLFDDTTHTYYDWTLSGSYVLTLDVTSGSPTITVATNRKATVNVALAGNDGLTKAGGGTMQLGNASNNYTGPTVVSAGTLTLRISNVIPDASSVEIAGGATLEMNAKSDTIDALSGGGTVINSYNATSTLTVGANNGSGLFSGAIKNGSSSNYIVALTKVGTGIQILSGSNSYTGATTISGGILVAAHDSALGGSAPTINSGGALAVASGITLDKAATWNSGSTLAGLGTYRPAAATFSVASGVHVAPGIANGTDNIGTLTIGYSGKAVSTTFASGSYLDIDLDGASADRLNVVGTVTINSGANLTLNTISVPTAGKYTLLTASSGTFSNNFTVSGAPAGYRLAMNGTNNALNLIHKASIGAIVATPSAAAIITGGTVDFTFTVENSAPTDSDDLVFSAVAGTNTTGTVGGTTTVAAQGTSGAVSGLSFNGATVGLGQTGTFTVSDANASNSPQQGMVAVDVYDHASGSVGGTTLVMPDVIVGYSGPVASTGSITVSNALGTRVNLKTTNNGPIGNFSLSDVSGVAPGGSDTISATLDTGQAAGAYSQVFMLTYADDSALNGASSNVGTEGITISGMVLDHSNASFLATNQDTLTVDFGTLPVGGVVTLPFDIWNLVTTAGCTANLDLDSVDAGTGDVGTLFTDLAPFTNQAAGTSSTWTAYFDTSTPGGFSATYTLRLSDEDLPGEAAGQVLYLTLQGNVSLGSPVPEPGIVGLTGLTLLALRRRIVRR